MSTNTQLIYHCLCVKVKRNLETALSHWDDFDRLHQQLVEWVTDVENRLASDPEFKADLPEKRSSLEKYQYFGRATPL